jgi:SNF2 family DNA or RNA helicase
LNRQADIHIINRENVVWLLKHLGNRKMPFDMVVIDELSSFKSYKAARFKALKKIRPQIKRVVGLTGTPAPNGLEELWPQIYLLDGGFRLGRTINTYLDMYFETRNIYLPYTHELREGAARNIYDKLSDLCVSMKAVII